MQLYHILLLIPVNLQIEFFFTPTNTRKMLTLFTASINLSVIVDSNSFLPDFFRFFFGALEATADSIHDALGTVYSFDLIYSQCLTVGHIKIQLEY